MLLHMSDKSEAIGAEKSAERVVKHNEKSNVPLQTEEEEAKTFENAKVEHLADDEKIRQKKKGLE